MPIKNLINPNNKIRLESEIKKVFKEILLMKLILYSNKLLYNWSGLNSIEVTGIISEIVDINKTEFKIFKIKIIKNLLPPKNLKDSKILFIKIYFFTIFQLVYFCF